MATCCVDLEYDLILTTNKGNKYYMNYVVPDVECYAESYYETCHGLHDIVEVSDSDLEYQQAETAEWLCDNLTNEELTDRAIEDEIIPEDESVIEWNFKGN